MEKSKKSGVWKRILSTLILAPLVLGALYHGWTTTLILVLLVGTILAWEWAEMIPNKHSSVYALSYQAALFVTTAFIYPWYIGYPLSVIFAITLFVWWKAKDEKHRRLLTLGVPYIALGIGSIVWLYTWVSPIVALWLIVAVWCVDIGGYLVGSTVKGPKLAPQISPNKTWSGLLGAIVFSALVSWGFGYYIIPEWTVWAVATGAVLAVIAQCGDLLESKVKRYLKIKDSSNLIPGHGGMFDRVDGLIFAAPFVLLWCVLLIYIAG